MSMVRSTRSRLTALAVAAVAGLVATPTARAGLLPVSFTLAPEGGNSRYSYGIVLTTDAYIKPGDYFTIYDFAGFVPGSATQPADWSFGAADKGKTPGNVHPSNDPTLPDLTWTYTGPQVMGQKGLGIFSALSSIDNFAFKAFTAQTHRAVDGHIDSNITDASVPVPGEHAPEPAALALMGISLPLVSALKLLRRRRTR
jgi:hypothetical protein